MRRRDALAEPEVVHGLRELEAALAAEPGADPDLALLVADVDAARPEPRAAFLASLDARVHAGFPTERATPRRRPDPWHARIRPPRILVRVGAVSLLAGLVVAAVLLQGGRVVNDSASVSGPARAVTGATPSTSGGRGSASAAGDSASSSTAMSAPAPRPAVETSAAAVAPKSAPAPAAALPSLPSAAPRKVQRAAELTLTPAIDAVQETADGVVRETQAAGGYVQRSQVATQDGGGDASFTLRIPSARLDDALARLSKLAHVGALTQSATDITATTVSAAGRLADARAERAALLRALGRATTGRQVAALKARLRDNRSEIAARKGALDAVRRRADLATVGVTVQGTDRPGAGHGGAWTPRDALRDAGRVLEVAAGVALVALAVLVPLGVLGALALLTARTVRRRRRETALDRTG